MTAAGELEVVASVAAGLGLGPVTPAVISLAKHTTVRLTPLPLVARVRSTSDPNRAKVDLSRELDVASHLAARLAPVVRPARDVAPGPHVRGRCAITLWEFVPHRVAESDDDAWLAARALQRLHEAFADFPGTLSPFTDAVAGCADLIADRHHTPDLGSKDRRFLGAVHACLLGMLGSHALRCVPIHGDAHLGNALITEGGVVWGDLEATCLGPREWDVACLPAATWPTFDGIDLDLTRCLADLRSLCVAAWCWADRGRSPQVDEAAEHHLQSLRERFGQD